MLTLAWVFPPARQKPALSTGVNHGISQLPREVSLVQTPPGVSNPNILLGLRLTWMMAGTQSADVLTPYLESMTLYLMDSAVVSGQQAQMMSSRTILSLYSPPRTNTGPVMPNI